MELLRNKPHRSVKIMFFDKKDQDHFYDLDLFHDLDLVHDLNHF